MHHTKNDIPLEKRSAAISLLNSYLASFLDLILQFRQAHWNVKGPQFISLHKLFESIADELVEASDTIAERITALGGTAEGTISVIAVKTILPSYSLTIYQGKESLEALSNSLSVLGKSIRKGIVQTEDLEDAGTTDLLTGLSRDLDKKLWLIEAHLQSDK